MAELVQTLPEVSIIVPLYRDIAVIPRLFLTLRAYINDPRFEIICIDDASGDETPNMLKALREELAACNMQLVLASRNEGPAASRNKGMRLARGQYFAFLDSDDGWHVDKLAIQLEVMKKTGAELCGTLHAVLAIEELASKAQESMPAALAHVRRIQWPGVLFKSPFSTPSVVMHRRVGMFFAEHIRYAEDYNLWIKVAAKHLCVRIDLPLTFTFKHDYLSGEASLSSAHFAMQRGVMASYWDVWLSSSFKGRMQILLLLAMAFSCLKYLRRLLLISHHQLAKVRGLRLNQG